MCLKWRLDFNRDIGIILFVLGKGKRIKIMCNCPPHSARFVQQSSHMGTIKRMGKYLWLKANSVAVVRGNPVEMATFWVRCASSIL